MTGVKRFHLPLLLALVFLIPPSSMAELTIDSPENITYNTTSVSLNVSTNLTSVVEWWYSLDGNATNVTFTPNITLEGLMYGITHNLTVSVNGSNESGSAYGSGNYGDGFYGYAEIPYVVEIGEVWFTINQILDWHATRITWIILFMALISVIGFGVLKHAL